MTLNGIRAIQGTVALAAIALSVGVPCFGIFPRRGSGLLGSFGVAIESSGALLLVDSDLDAVVRVDPATGDRTIVSDKGTGGGPTFSGPVGIAVEASGDLVVVDLGRRAVLRVDAVTGDRAFIELVELECPTAPTPACTTGFAKGRLTVIERSAGRERLTADLLKGPPIAQTDLGNPTGVDGTAFTLCVYDDADAQVASLVVDRAGNDCGTKPCWKNIGGEGYGYRDRDASSSGVRSMNFTGGDAGDSRLRLSAGNKAVRGQTSLPTGIAAALSTTTSVTLQMIADNGACYGTTLTNISKRGSTSFKAK